MRYRKNKGAFLVNEKVFHGFFTARNDENEDKLILNGEKRLSQSYNDKQISGKKEIFSSLR